MICLSFYNHRKSREMSILNLIEQLKNILMVMACRQHIKIPMNLYDIHYSDSLTF